MTSLKKSWDLTIGSHLNWTRKWRNKKIRTPLFHINFRCSRMSRFKNVRAIVLRKERLDLNSGHPYVFLLSSKRRNVAASRYAGPKFILLSEGLSWLCVRTRGEWIESACVCPAQFLCCMHSPLAASRARVCYSSLRHTANETTTPLQGGT